MVISLVTKSPFSLSYKWRFKLSDENPEATTYFTKYEKQAIAALKELDVIGANQLTRIFFSGDKKKTRKMAQKGIIVQHCLQNELKEIPFYTLSPYLIRQIGGMEPWTLSIREVLSRMVFFQLYARMTELFPVTINRCTKRPFIGSLKRDDGTIFYVGVLRGNLEEWEYYLKWELSHERIILVAEQLSFLRPLEELLQDKMVRVTTDIDLKNAPIEQLFYEWTENQWKREGK